MASPTKALFVRKRMTGMKHLYGNIEPRCFLSLRRH
jgi:hypothetical protein